MRRRDAVRLIPLSFAAMTAGAGNPLSAEMMGGPMCPKMQGQPMNPLSLRYLDKVKEMLGWIKSTQSENILEAAHEIARTYKNGGTCWCSWDMGHNTNFDVCPGRNGKPEIFTMGYDPEKTKKGDLFLASIWGGPHEDLVKKGIFVIGGPAPWGQDAKMPELIERESGKVRLRPYSDIWIETNITTIGAVMELPGSPAPIGPVSGIIGLTTFWMMLADACRILSRDGVKVNIDGDEPELSGDKIEWTKQNQPLMDEYFDTIMRQMETVAGEIGSMGQAATMAVDSVLDGGKVYVYSRYRDNLAVEGQTRRGGLALTRGMYVDNGKLITFDGPFKGSPKDTVIMGINKPDDEVDLKCLEEFRKAGMKIISMGPRTRDWKVQEGKTVPSQTDLHIGNMFDTYGLYAFPGLKRKVCPTSGAMLNQIFWATCMEIAEEVIRRTGNAPGVFFSAAIKGGTEHMIRVNEIYKVRGY
jgi:uncharacterized phosphosugar-binding protein